MSEQWQTYLRHDASCPTSVLVDVNITDKVDILDFSNLFTINLVLKNPTQDGLMGEQEFETLCDFEDRFDSFCTENTKVLFVGRLTALGKRTLYFYGSDLQPLKTYFLDIKSEFDYELSFEETEDRKWKTYQEVLYPTVEEWQLIANRMMVRNLYEHGDDLITERTLEHFASFSNMDDYESFKQAMVECSFEITDKPAFNADENELSVSDYPYVIEFSHQFAPDLESINILTLGILKVALKHNGRYEGWETSSVKS
jgi:regulator of RNase E activity RraB